jgi:tetratricopeptide (TPR) repeat protein
MKARASPWWPLLCALVAVLVYGRALDNGFALDDVRLVESNLSIVSLGHVPALFLEPYWNVAGENYGLYRPITVASLSINRAMFGAGPFGFHLVNILLHAAVTSLAWLCLKRSGTHYGTAFVGGLTFAVLPIHVEAVANVAGRAELLAALFVLAAWIAHRRAIDAEAPAGRWPLAAPALYLAAVLSKESAVLAPALFFADDALRGRTGTPRRRGLLTGYVAAGVVMLLLRASALRAHQLAAATIPLDNPAAAAGAWPRVLTAAWIQLSYALISVAPWRLVSDYSFDAIPVARSLADGRVVCGAAFLVALAWGAVWGWKRSRPIALSILSWVVFFLPSANLLFPTGTIMAERLAYLPSFGICLAIGHLGAGLAARGSTPMSARVRVLVGILGAVVLSVWAARGMLRVPDWKDNLRLALTDVATMPRSAKLQAGAGMFLAEAGRAREAEEHLRLAVGIYPDYAQMHYNLAVLLARRGARADAEAHLRRAIELAPGNPQPQRLLDQLSR